MGRCKHENIILTERVIAVQVTEISKGKLVFEYAPDAFPSGSFVATCDDCGVSVSVNSMSKGPRWAISAMNVVTERGPND